MNSKTKTKRPKGLDKRVYIPSDFPGFIYTEKYDLMYLILEPRHQSSRHKWSVTFDPVASGRKPVRFNAVETMPNFFPYHGMNSVWQLIVAYWIDTSTSQYGALCYANAPVTLLVVQNG